MRLRFILSETWSSLKRNVPMLLSVMLVTFISFLFIGASVLTQAQITKAKGDWYSKVEVVGVDVSRWHQPIRELHRGNRGNADSDQ